jgi:probable HAF family extracellular repeat protein
VTQITGNGINDHGQVVGQFSDSHGVPHGFIYEEESFCQLDYPGAAETNILGVNNLDQMVGMFTTLTATAGFLYDRGTFSPPMPYPGPRGREVLTVQNGVNDRGEIVGVFQMLGWGNTAPLKAGNYEPLIYPGAIETAARGINNSGQVVGSFPDVGGAHGFVYLENVVCSRLP